MANCKFCGLEIYWHENVPRNFDRRQSDHRESCVGMRRERREVVRDRNHEVAVEGFLTDVKRQQKKNNKAMRRAMRKGLFV